MICVGNAYVQLLSMKISFYGTSQLQLLLLWEFAGADGQVLITHKSKAATSWPGRGRLLGYNRCQISA